MSNTSESVLARLAEVRVLPVVTLDDPGPAAEVGRALAAGGVPVAEVTFRRPGAERAVRALAAAGDVLVGAGTVITPAQVELAADAGAAFVVSPGLDEAVLERAASLGVLALPGVASATEIQSALRAGLTAVKLFPAGPLGGPAMVSALAAPFPAVRFVPTGGIGEADLAAYLARPSVLAVGGSWLTPRSAIEAQAWDEITALAARARSAAGAVAA